jgi:uncharacterized protein YbjT (DUF2867 family)
VRVLVLGGTGFVGRALVRQLSTAGHEITLVSRRTERNRHLRLIPNLTLVEEPKLSDLVLRKLVQGQDAVINLIGILNPSGRDNFHNVHVAIARRVASACQAEAVCRLLHMSALGASTDAPSEYLQSKAEAEVVINSHGLKTTIFRPSVIFGNGDQFINKFNKLLNLTPALGVVCPQAQLSPVWVEDVARAFVKAVEDKTTIGQIYELCGGRTYNMFELVQAIAETSEQPTRLLPLSDRTSKLMAKILGVLPGKVFSYDNYLSLQVPSVCHKDHQPENWQPRSLRNYLMQELAPAKTRARYMKMRQQAGRDLADRV